MAPTPYTIADAIERVIGAFPAAALNLLAPPVFATDADLTGLDKSQIEVFEHAHRRDVAAGRPDDGVLVRIYTLNQGGQVGEVEARHKAVAAVAALVRDEKEREKERRRARPRGWVRPPPPPLPSLRRFEVERVLGALIDFEWQQARLEIYYVADDRSMRRVPRSTARRLQRLTPDGDWVIASRDWVADPKPLFLGPHIAKADLDTLMKAVRRELAPPAWLKNLTPHAVEKIRTSAGIAPERWAVIGRLYVARLWLWSHTHTNQPPLVMRDSRDNPLDYDRQWGVSVEITQPEIRALRAAYLVAPRKGRES